VSRAIACTTLVVGSLLIPFAIRAQAVDTLRAYGPGGPLPAMQEAAAAYGAKARVHVEVTGGPADQWLARAKQDADLVFSGSEHMMSDFIRLMDDRIVESTVEPMYLREAAILVRKGNPKGIRGFEDLLQRGVNILVVNGAGQTGLWEDMAGRSGDIATVRAFRRNIRHVAGNSGEAKERWTTDGTLDAWLIWTIWQVANPELADQVAPGPEWSIFRDSGIALTRRGLEREHARGFREFLLSPEGAAIFRKWGWLAPPGGQRP
jgi:accessory colonization factor AcfC